MLVTIHTIYGEHDGATVVVVNAELLVTHWDSLDEEQDQCVNHHCEHSWLANEHSGFRPGNFDVIRAVVNHDVFVVV